MGTRTISVAYGYLGGYGADQRLAKRPPQLPEAQEEPQLCNWDNLLAKRPCPKVRSQVILPTQAITSLAVVRLAHNEYAHWSCLACGCGVHRKSVPNQGLA